MRSFFSNRYVEVITAILISFFLFLLAGQTVGDWIMDLTLNRLDSDLWSFLAFYLGFIGIWIVGIGYMLITKKNRPMLQLLGRKPKGNRVGMALIWGLSCGFGMNLIVGLVAMASGDIHLTYNGFNPGLLILFLAAVLIQSGAEELCERLFLFQRVKKAFPNKLKLAVIINAAVFAAIHLFNDGVTLLSLLTIFLVGVLYTEMIVYLDSFWAPVVAHTSWNFTQNILLGLPNSGIVSVYSLFKLDAASASDGFAYSVGFGIEGCPLTVILLCIAIVVLYLYGTKVRKKECLNVWA